MSKRKSASRIIIVFSGLCAGITSLAGVKADSLKVRDSIPAFDSTVQGREVQYVIRFDGLIDHASSRIDITQSGRVIHRSRCFWVAHPMCCLLRAKHQLPDAIYFTGRQSHRLMGPSQAARYRFMSSDDGHKALFKVSAMIASFDIQASDH